MTRNVYKCLPDKEIRMLSIRRIPSMTLRILARIGTKTKPIQSQNKAKTKPIFHGRIQESEYRRKKAKINTSSLIIKEYDKKPDWTFGENKTKQSQNAGLWPENSKL